MTHGEEDEVLRQIREALSQPRDPDEVEQDQVDMHFESMLNPGHWCPACGQEQPGQPSCAECYGAQPATPEELLSKRQDVSRMTPADLRDLAWLWKS